MTTKTPILLWSASNALKLRISQLYFRYHYVWCSPVFDAEATGGGQAASSDPATIYRRLHQDVRGNDRHSDAIARQRNSQKALALNLVASGVISPEDAAEIGTMIDVSQIYDWRPVLYVIPYAPVADRVKLVPVKDRANLDPEYIIPDLKDHEFEVIEPIPCR